MIVSPTGDTSVGAPVLSVEPSAAAVRFDPGPGAGASGVWTEQAIDAESRNTATAGYIRTLTQVFERGVYRHFVMHLHRPRTHPRVQATLRRMLADERGHLSWVKEWLARRTGAQRAAVPLLMRRYSAVDAEIRKQLLCDYEWPELACAS